MNGGSDNFPTYDNAADIYKSLIGQVDSAIDLINTASAGAPIPGSDDVLYGGDMSKWIKFANTLKLKLLMHTTASPVMDIKGALSGPERAD